jgi:hypothetical protein
VLEKLQALYNVAWPISISIKVKFNARVQTEFWSSINKAIQRHKLGEIAFGTSRDKSVLSANN